MVYVFSVTIHFRFQMTPKLGVITPVYFSGLMESGNSIISFHLVSLSQTLLSL